MLFSPLAPSVFSQSSSLIVSIPSSAALASFEPAPGPATTRSVFLETEAATFAPSRSAIALASSRVMRSSEPVKTTVLPATGLAEATASIGTGVTWPSSASRTSSLCFSAKKSATASATTSPIPSILLISARASEPSDAACAVLRSASNDSKWRARRRALVSPTCLMPSA